MYLNWDYDDDQLQILRGAEDIVKRYNLLSVAEEKNTLALDEIHKYREWRNYVKGFYDKHKDFVNFIITGSAKLDAFRTGGDSMMGRYFPYQIHPFSISELVNTRRRREEIIPPKEIERDIYKNFKSDHNYFFLSYDENDNLISTAETTLVFVNMKTGKPIMCPDFILERLFC